MPPERRRAAHAHCETPKLALTAEQLREGSPGIWEAIFRLEAGRSCKPAGLTWLRETSSEASAGSSGERAPVSVPAVPKEPELSGKRLGTFRT
jgi:hypothetical protein